MTRNIQTSFPYNNTSFNQLRQYRYQKLLLLVYFVTVALLFFFVTQVPLQNDFVQILQHQDFAYVPSVKFSLVAGHILEYFSNTTILHFANVIAICLVEINTFFLRGNNFYNEVAILNCNHV